MSLKLKAFHLQKTLSRELEKQATVWEKIRAEDNMIKEYFTKCTKKS